MDTNDGDVEITPGYRSRTGERAGDGPRIEMKEMNINGNQMGNRVEIKVHRPNHVWIRFSL